MFLPRLPPRFDVACVDADSADPVFRAEAAAALGRAGSEHERATARAPLRRLARDPDFRVRLAAVEALGHLALASEVPVLESTLDDPVKPVREQAVVALAALPGADEALLRALAEGAAEVRFQAALALGDRRAEPARGPLLALLEDDDPELRVAAILGLEALGPSPHLDAFAARLGDAPSVRAEAARVLADHGDERASTALAEVLRGRSPTREFVSAAARLDPRGLSSELRGVAFGRGAPLEVRALAATALATVGDERAHRFVDSLLSSFFRARRIAALVAIGELRARPFLPRLLALHKRPRGLPPALVLHTLERFEHEPEAARLLARQRT